jgi:hypothetical protein
VSKKTVSLNEETKEQQPNFLQSCIPDPNVLKMLLKSAVIKKKKETKDLADRTFIVVLNIKSQEWRSSAPDEAGLTPRYDQEQVTIRYDEPRNLVFVSLVDKDKVGSKVGECQTTV